MEFLKEFLGEELYSQVEAKLKGNDKIKLANLASGEYVSKGKYDDKVSELDKANQTITDLSEKAKNFEGVDVKDLQKQIADGNTKYAEGQKTWQNDLKKRDAIDAWLDAHPTKHRGLMRSQFNYDKLNIDDKGSVSGIDEIGNTLLESYSDMFTKSNEPEPEGNGGMKHGTDPKESKPEEMSMDEYIAWREKNN